eukprot:NODE_10235_length_292_cov_52.720165_g8467_i0.p2 GENE.NODE_10235_length_292_cov_52.720165_g8467_i0~~NODE_10235_length_292_cov_52.720165_g8467_i0.p2  ORF type:complete len:79 (+),score=12.83 NODE_10235_length_292_cov_52.720165_g8467_i0:35-238(+)
MGRRRPAFTRAHKLGVRTPPEGIGGYRSPQKQSPGLDPRGSLARLSLLQWFSTRLSHKTAGTPGQAK